MTEMKGKVLIYGIGASNGVVVGRVRVVNGDEDKIAKVQPGDIIVADKLRPEHDIYMKKAGAFITNVGGKLSHAAIVAREWKVPCITGTMSEGFNATTELKDGQQVVVDGTEGRVYEYKGPALYGHTAPDVSPVASKMAELAAKKGIVLNAAFMEKLKNRS